MKRIFKFTAIAASVMILATACKQNGATENSQTSTEAYDDSIRSVEEPANHPGQNIGNNTDSTSIDGNDPNPSNN